MRDFNISKSRVIRWTFWLVTVGLALNILRVQEPNVFAALMRPQSIVGSPRPVPYTAILQDYFVNSDGSVVPKSRMTWAVRGDGSRVIEATNPTASGATFSERILNFASGKKMYIMGGDKQETTTFSKSGRGPSAWLPDPRDRCLIQGVDSEQFVGEENVDGYRTAKITDGPVTSWFALDFGCAIIKERADWGGGQVSETKLLALIPGEPSPALFEEPANLREVPFSQMFERSH